jgi:hypothetical protein
MIDRRPPMPSHKEDMVLKKAVSSQVGASEIHFIANLA